MSNESRRGRYIKVLERFEIDWRGHHLTTGEEDAAELLNSDDTVYDRFCVVTMAQGADGPIYYAKPSCDNFRSACLEAVVNVDDDMWTEMPVEIIDLDDGTIYFPNWENIPWEECEMTLGDAPVSMEPPPEEVI